MNVEEIKKNYDIIVLMPFGSLLYGTEVKLEDLNEKELKDSDKYLSDKDYKGIYLPTISDIYNNRIKKSIMFNSKNNSIEKNKPDDVDCELYSLQYFIEMALNGDTTTIDMMNCPEDQLIINSGIWMDIINNRSKFYTKNLKTLVDYARGQAAKYGVKGSRIAAAKSVMDFLKQFEVGNNNPKLKDIWDELPEGEHIFKHPQTPISKFSDVKLRMYEVCNRNAQETARACYLRDEIISKFLNTYGKRARMAAKNEGIDWKAISHAIRAGIQLEELINKGTVTYPLKDCEFIKKVKLGRFSYFCIAVYLDNMVDRLEEMNKQSSFPEKPDYKFWNDFVISIVEKYSRW